MAKTYPRKQTAIIFVVCFVLVGGVAVYSYGLPSTKNSIKYQNSVTNITTTIGNNTISTTTDWKNQFLDTNKDKAGTAFKADATASRATATEAPLTPTDLLGRNFFTKYVELRKAGLTTDSTAVNSAASQVIAESVAGVATPKAYTSSNMKVVAVGSDLTLTKAYAESLMNTLKSWMPAQNEAEIAVNAFEKGDMTLLKGIDPIIAGYKSALNRLLGIPVIQPLAQNHLDLINGIAMQIFNAQALRNVDKDPVTGLAAVSLEVKSLEAISAAVASMQTYFTKNGVTFNLPISGSVLQSQ